MELFISRAQFFILISTMIIFSTSILAMLPEADRAELIARHQEQRKAMLASRTDVSSQLQPVIDLNSDAPTDTGYYVNFAGAYFKAPPNGTYSNITAKWPVPAISLPEGASGDGVWSMFEWVGIGAINCQYGWLGAGIFSSITVSGGSPSYQAEVFYEWGSASATTLDLDVEVGDVIDVAVSVISSTGGLVVARNRDKKTSATATASAPNPSSSLCVEDVEWVIEGPGLNPAYLSSFKEMSFQNCKARTTTNLELDLVGAGIVNMKDISKKTLAKAKIINSTRLHFRYEA